MIYLKKITIWLGGLLLESQRGRSVLIYVVLLRFLNVLLGHEKGIQRVCAFFSFPVFHAPSWAFSLGC